MDDNEKSFEYLKNIFTNLLFCIKLVFNSIEKKSDATLITKSTEIKSSSGNVFTLGGGAVSWKSS